jgi:hypothetical protein
MVTLLISLLLAILPVLGVFWIAVSGWLATVDGLFLTLILLAMAGVFLLNAGMLAKAMGLVPSFGKKQEQAKAVHGA